MSETQLLPAPATPTTGRPRISHRVCVWCDPGTSFCGAKPRGPLNYSGRPKNPCVVCEDLGPSHVCDDGWTSGGR